MSRTHRGRDYRVSEMETGAPMPLDPECGPPGSVTEPSPGGGCNTLELAAYDMAWTALLAAVALFMAWALYLCLRKLPTIPAIVSAVATLTLPGVGAIIVIALYHTGYLPRVDQDSRAHQQSAELGHKQ